MVYIYTKIIGKNPHNILLLILYVHTQKKLQLSNARGKMKDILALKAKSDCILKELINMLSTLNL